MLVESGMAYLSGDVTGMEGRDGRYCDLIDEDRGEPDRGGRDDMYRYMFLAALQEVAERAPVS